MEFGHGRYEYRPPAPRPSRRQNARGQRRRPQMPPELETSLSGNSGCCRSAKLPFETEFGPPGTAAAVSGVAEVRKPISRGPPRPDIDSRLGGGLVSTAAIPSNSTLAPALPSARNETEVPRCALLDFAEQQVAGRRWHHARSWARSHSKPPGSLSSRLAPGARSGISPPAARTADCEARSCC